MPVRQSPSRIGHAQRQRFIESQGRRVTRIANEDVIVES